MSHLVRMGISVVAFLTLAGCGAATITPSSGDGGTCTDTWSGYGQGFFSSNCTSCHQGYGTQSGVKSQVSRIRSEIAAGQMPPKGLGAAEEQRAVLYLDCGVQ